MPQRVFGGALVKEERDATVGRIEEQSAVRLGVREEEEDGAVSAVRDGVLRVVPRLPATCQQEGRMVNRIEELFATSLKMMEGGHGMWGEIGRATVSVRVVSGQGLPRTC